MVRFKNPWGKGSQAYDSLFRNQWRQDLAPGSYEDAAEVEPPEFIQWIFRNEGDPSPDNCAKTIGINNVKLGKNVAGSADPDYLTNGMELTVEFKNNPPGYSYAFSRQAQYIHWYKEENKTTWVIAEDRSSFFPDNSTPFDSCTTPSQQGTSDTYHIYSVDRPGFDKFKFQKANPYLIINDEALLANFIEKITCTKTGTGEVAFEKEFNWHVKIYGTFKGNKLVYVDEKSEIEQGHIDMNVL